MQFKKRITTCALFLMSLTLSPRNFVSAQAVVPPPTAAQIAATVRKSGDGSAANYILAQAERRRSAGELKSISDTLVAIALSPTSPGLSIAMKESIVSALANAGRSKRGIPFASAGPALLRIAQLADDGFPAAAIGEIARQPDKPTAVRILVSIAESKNKYAYRAIQLLANAGVTQSVGSVALKQLWDGGTVAEPNASAELETVAHWKGWKRVVKSPCADRMH